MRLFPLVSLTHLATLIPALLVVIAAVPGRAELITSEFASLPIDEGWALVTIQGEGVTWVADGVYYQDMPNNCPPDPVCDSETYTRPIDSFNGRPNWIYEYRVSATGPSSEIQNGAPTVFSAFNAAGDLYNCTVSSDKIRFFLDVDLPILFIDTPSGAHTIRLEIFNDPPPTSYRWYVDSVLELESLAESPFPDFDSRIVLHGRSWMHPTLNAWFYVRAGDIPIAGSADFNSDGEVDDFEVFYIDECIQRGAAGEPAHPSCSWADVNADGTVNCADWDTIAETLWTGPGDPPPLAACTGNPIPAASSWGAAALLLLLLTAGTLVFRRGQHLSLPSPNV